MGGALPVRVGAPSRRLAAIDRADGPDCRVRDISHRPTIEQRIIQPGSGTVTLISAVRLRPGTEEAHRQLHTEAVAAAQQLGGLIRQELVPAVCGAQPETVALLTFQTRADLDRWLSAPVRRQLLDAMANLTAEQGLSTSCAISRAGSTPPAHGHRNSGS